MKKIRDLTKVKTIYKASVRTIYLKLDKSVVGDSHVKLNTIAGPQDVSEILRAIYAGLDDDQEHVVMLVLNAANEVVGYKLIASGRQDSAIIDIKVLFRNALLLGARNIIIAHNHPSGNLKPSVYDLQITGQIIASGTIIDIGVFDHCIVTSNGTFSIRNNHPYLFDGAEEQGV